MKKIVSFAAVAAMAAVCALPTFAYTNSTEAVNETQTISANETAQTSVYAEVGSTFTVTIPKKITLSGETKSGAYNVTCTGDIAGDEVVAVEPDSSFNMVQAGQADVTAAVTQETTKLRADNYTTELVAGEAKMATGATGSIAAADLTAGAWDGNFNFAIALNQE